MSPSCVQSGKEEEKILQIKHNSFKKSWLFSNVIEGTVHLVRQCQQAYHPLRTSDCYVLQMKIAAMPDRNLTKTSLVVLQLNAFRKKLMKK